MATSNNGHQISHHHQTFTIDYLQFSLFQPPFGFIMQITPQTAFLIFNNSITHGSNIIFGVYRPVIDMPGHYHCVGYSGVTDFEIEQMGRGVRHIINIDFEHGGVMQFMVLKLQPTERDDSGILDVTDADFEGMGDLMVLSNEIHNALVGDASPGISTPVQPFLDLNMPPPVQPLDLIMPPMDEDDVQLADDVAMHVLEIITYPSSLVHYQPEEEMAMIETSLDFDSMINDLTSDYDPTYEENLELEEQMGRVDSRLSEETIMQHIQITYYKASTTRSPSEEPDICVICQAEFEDHEFIGGLQCGHKYHVQCVKKWLQRVNNCPVCKATAVS